jgi:Uma2 family endonuclease
MVLEVQRSIPPTPLPHDPYQDPIVTWELLPDGFILPDDPVENIQQPALAAALTDALGAAGLITPTMLVASNFALLATVKQQLVIKAPDWLLVPQVDPVSPDTIRKSYTPNLQGDPVAIVMEFLSDEDGNELSLRATFPYGKLYFYERILKVPTYVTFDPYEAALEVRQLQANGRYSRQPPNAQGHFWIPAVQLFLGIWHGNRLTQTADWLRWWDANGNLLPWPAEQVKQERERAELMAAKLRELGIDPEAL